MAKYLRYAVARADDSYQKVVKEAVQLLEVRGRFSKTEVVEAAQLQAFDDAIRWDYVQRMIEEECGVSLVPLAASAFKRHSKEQAINAPEKFVALGHGKRTVGYCSVCAENGHLVNVTLDHKRKVLQGVSETYSAKRAEAVGEGVAIKAPETRLVDQVDTIEPEALPKPDEAAA